MGAKTLSREEQYRQQLIQARDEIKVLRRKLGDYIDLALWLEDECPKNVPHGVSHDFLECLRDRLDDLRNPADFPDPKPELPW